MENYELLDSGNGRKLEFFSGFIVDRPDPQAIWDITLPKSDWSADLTFTQNGSRGFWNEERELPNPWKLKIGDNYFVLKKSIFKHLGVFPEQETVWRWLEGEIAKKSSIEKVSVLNLFAYTGGASMSCLRAGADVCHVDSSEFAIDCAKENLIESGLSQKPIRFIVDDVKKFVDKEIRRGKKYDLIVLDPPVYGKGGGKSVWKLEDDLVPLLKNIKKLLSTRPIGISISGYASGFSHISYKQVLSDIFLDLGGSVFSGELSIKQKSIDKFLPCGIFARWER